MHCALPNSPKWVITPLCVSGHNGDAICEKETIINTPQSGGKGFTFIEVLIVVAILGILASVALPRWIGS